MDASACSSSVPGADLLRNLQNLSKPLSEEQILLITSHLNQVAQNTSQHTHNGNSYLSANLNVGKRRPDLTPPDLQGTPSDIQHFDLCVQRDAFEFIHSDAKIEQGLTQSQNWIVVDGVGRRFYHYQLYGAFWMMLNERGCRRGAILADSMGLGKTTTAYLYLLFNIFLVQNAHDIQDNPTRHCRPGVDICPSRNQWPIVCACEPSSVTNRLGLKPREGASLIFVPASLLSSWKLEWDALAVKSPWGSRPQVYVHHHNYQPHMVPSRCLADLSLQPVDDSELSYQLSVAGTRCAHLFIVLTTVESYTSQVQSYFGARRLYGYSIPARSGSNQYTDGVAWARILRDEAQLTPNDGTRLYQILNSLSHNMWIPPNLLILTATPMLRNGIGDIVACVRAINDVSPEITKTCPDPDLLNISRLNQLVKDCRDITTFTSARQARRLLEKVGRMLSFYCIRREAASIQNGKILVYVPPLESYDLVCQSVGDSTLPVSDAERLLKKYPTSEWIEHLLNRDESQKGTCEQELFLENAHKARVLATVPGLIRYKDISDWAWSSIRAYGWHEQPEQSPFYADMDALESSSGKLQHLREFLKVFLPCRNGDDRPEKLVVVSEFPVVCMIILCFCLRLNLRCEWIHADCSTVERAHLVQVFQGKKSPTTGIGRGTDIRILIGASRIIGQGLTLTRAHRLVLMEPSLHAAVEAQVADRVHRIGSPTDRCWFYRLINPHSRIEQFLLLQQEDQKRFQQTVQGLRTMSSGEVELSGITP